jgi:hypothetical protein
MQDRLLGSTKTVNGLAPATTIGGTGVSPGIQDRPASGDILKVGATAVLAATSPGRDHVVGVAVFLDGTKQIIIDKTI